MTIQFTRCGSASECSWGNFLSVAREHSISPPAFCVTRKENPTFGAFSSIPLLSSVGTLAALPQSSYEICQVRMWRSVSISSPLLHCYLSSSSPHHLRPNISISFASAPSLLCIRSNTKLPFCMFNCFRYCTYLSGRVCHINGRILS